MCKSVLKPASLRAAILGVWTEWWEVKDMGLDGLLEWGGNSKHVKWREQGMRDGKSRVYLGKVKAVWGGRSRELQLWCSGKSKFQNCGIHPDAVGKHWWFWEWGCPTWWWCSRSGRGGRLSVPKLLCDSGLRRWGSHPSHGGDQWEYRGLNTWAMLQKKKIKSTWYIMIMGMNKSNKTKS